MKLFSARRDKLLYSPKETYEYTWFLILLLILVYIVEIFFLQESLEKFMTFTTDLLSLKYIYTLFTSIFLHLNLIHLISNLIALYVFGRLVEKHLGIGVIFAFIIGGIFANIVSSIISFLMQDLFFSLGASGGIAGLIMLGILFEPFKIYTFLGWIIIYIDIIGLGKESSTNHLAHVGGYLALIVLFFFMNFRNRQKLIRGLIVNILFLLLLGYLVFFTSIIEIFR